MRVQRDAGPPADLALAASGLQDGGRSDLGDVLEDKLLSAGNATRVHLAPGSQPALVEILVPYDSGIVECFVAGHTLHANA